MIYALFHGIHPATPPIPCYAAYILFHDLHIPCFTVYTLIHGLYPVSRPTPCFTVYTLIHGLYPVLRPTPTTFHAVHLVSRYTSTARTLLVMGNCTNHTCNQACVCMWLFDVDGCVWIGRGRGGRRREHKRSRQEKEKRIGPLRVQFSKVTVKYSERHRGWSLRGLPAYLPIQPPANILPVQSCN